MRVSVVVPVLNEAPGLHENMLRLHRFLASQDQWQWEIVIADNGSTDHTLDIARRLASENSGIRAVHFGEPGRGRALREAWSSTEADILSYMDADLSTDLEAFPRLIAAVADGAYDLATGSRLLRPELTTRCLRREVTSRCYNLLLRLVLRTRLSDAQCGFKALTRSAARRLLPMVEDAGWFFDTELLVLAERLGYRISELPVKWVERRESRVKVLPTALHNLKGLLRLRKQHRHLGNW